MAVPMQTQYLLVESMLQICGRIIVEYIATNVLREITKLKKCSAMCERSVIICVKDIYVIILFFANNIEPDDFVPEMYIIL